MHGVGPCRITALPDRNPTSNDAVPPDDEKYFPSAQEVQTVLATMPPYVPGLQRAQFPDVTAPDAVEYVPGLHGMQVICPDNSLYVPGVHSVHSSALDCTVPGEQAAHV